MSDVEDHMQVVDEFDLDDRLREFYKVFFNPCRRRRDLALSQYLSVCCDNRPFIDSVTILHRQGTASETADSTDCASVAACVSDTEKAEIGISDGGTQPDLLRSTEGSKSLSLPTSPDVVPEMDDWFLKRQWNTPIQKGSMNPNLRRTVSCEETMQETGQRKMPDYTALRRMSSAYGSQDQSLSTSGQNEDEADASLGREDEDQAIFTPSSTQDTVPLCSGVVTPSDILDSDDESTTVLQPVCFPALSGRTNDSTAEFADSSALIPSGVTEWSITDEGEFLSAYSPGTSDSYATAVEWSAQEPIQPAQHGQLTLHETLNYHQLYAVIADLENRVIQGLLVALLRENSSPEFVQSVAQALLLPTAGAEAIGAFHNFYICERICKIFVIFVKGKQHYNIYIVSTVIITFYILQCL